MLKIEKLTKTYSGNNRPSVDNLTLEVSDGEIFGFIGPNGAGKSTTIKCITGIVGFEGGSVVVNGKDLKSATMAAKREIGYVSDDHILYEGLTGIEFINFMCDVFGVAEADRKARLDKYLELFSLEGAIKSQIKTYSHGMKQKLNIIGALIHEPKLWILDEPMTGLDPKSSFNLKQLMKEHAAKGNSVFFSSHVLEVVEKVCDRVGIIDDGKLITSCTMAELKQTALDESLEQLFLKLTDDSAKSGFADAQN
jgi:ABC-2 type transport system ATP-binding protein